MKIVKPFAKLWVNNDNKQHIIKCAQICYAADKIPANPDNWLEEKWKHGHKSIFRHATYYYAIPVVVCTEKMRDFFKHNPYIGYYENDEWVFISVNGQTYREVPWLNHLFKYSTSELGLKGFINTDDDREGIENIIRRTILVQTQISTSRELNRTSPNNICEQSTRFCNFTQNKFEGEVSICEPHWLYLLPDGENERYVKINLGYNKYTVALDIYDSNMNHIGLIEHNHPSGEYITDDKYAKHVFRYLYDAIHDAEDYNIAISEGIPAQDARGSLPLDTATKVVYTYRIEEWRNILNLRYYGLTGKPHPNAKIAANFIRIELNKSGLDTHFFNEHFVDDTVKHESTEF